MRPKSKVDRRCTYVVPIEKTTADIDDLRTLCDYLSTLRPAACEVIVLDSSADEILEENRRVLRWVAHHFAVQQPYDVVRIAAEVGSCEKVIIAGEQIRYTLDEIADVCALLETHEVVEPQDYLDPLPWWGGIEAGRMLLHRGVDPQPDHGATFAFRRNVLRALRSFEATGTTDPVKRLAMFGAEVFAALDLFVRRCPPRFSDWLRQRPRDADDDFGMPVKTAFFFALLPMAALLAAFGGARVTTGYAGAVAFAAVLLAVRGRAGAGSFFPARACLFAPLWVLERSISVYWALLQKVRRAAAEPVGPVFADRARSQRAASGE